MKWRACLAAAMCSLMALHANAWAGEYQGIVSHVGDGDTVWIRPDGGGRPRQLRLQGIDAPEICQPGGREAREALAGRVLHRRVSVTTSAEDDYHRPLGQLVLHGEDVGGWMVRRGHAWSYRFRRDAGPYAHEEARARHRRIGLWAGGAQPVEPRVFRKQQGRCPAPAG